MSLILKNLTISNHKYKIFDRFNFGVGRGEVVSLMGPSGSGKSTLLAFISGTIHSQEFDLSGRIFLDGEEITFKPIEERKVGLLFQDDLLFPHMTVEENLSFALPTNMSKQEKKTVIEENLQTSQLSGYEKRYPHTLSGGQRARISLLRTLISKPKVMLLDEPFSKLDAPLRKEFRHFAFEYIKNLTVPTILVTHDESDIPKESKLITLGEPTLLQEPGLPPNS